MKSDEALKLARDLEMYTRQGYTSDTMAARTLLKKAATCIRALVAERDHLEKRLALEKDVHGNCARQMFARTEQRDAALAEAGAGEARALAALDKAGETNG